MTYKNIIINVTIFALLFLPMLAFSQASPSTGLTYECVSGSGATAVYGNCTFQDLLRAVQNFTNQLTIYVLAFTVVPIAYAGYLFMTSGGNAGARSKAKDMLVKVAIGIFFMLSAWLIVSLIANALLAPSFQGVNPIRP